jgi:large subunit ribosomal protein L4
MTSSPIWRGGGRAFPNKPDENFSQKVNRKMFRAGIASIVSKLVQDGRLSVVEALGVDSPKTKILFNILKFMGLTDRVLIIDSVVDDNLWLSARNMHKILVLEPHQVDPVSLVRYDQVLITREAVKSFEEIYS